MLYVLSKHNTIPLFKKMLERYFYSDQKEEEFNCRYLVNVLEIQQMIPISKLLGITPIQILYPCKSCLF